MVNKPTRQKCPHCKQDFARADALKRHLKTIHGVEVSFERKPRDPQVVFDEAIAAQELSKRGYIVAKQEAPIDRRINLILKDKGEVSKIGLVSDIHLGSRFQQLTHLWNFYQRCAREGVEAVLVAGD